MLPFLCQFLILLKNLSDYKVKNYAVRYLFEAFSALHAMSPQSQPQLSLILEECQQFMSKQDEKQIFQGTDLSSTILTFV